jgi:hypothetical protein
MTAYAGQLLKPTIEAAFGADPSGDPAGWSWTNLTSRLVVEDGVPITRGRTDWSSRCTPASVTCTLLNTDGALTPGNPSSVYWPNVDRTTPIRVSVPYGTGTSTTRLLAFAVAWAPLWDTGLAKVVVKVKAAGRLELLARGEDPQSPLFRSLTGVSSFLSGGSPLPVAYWPCEDEAGALNAASPIPGVRAMDVSGVSFASDSELPGSEALPTLSTGATLVGTIPPYTPTTRWVATLVLHIPNAVTAATTVLEVGTTGTAAYWRIIVEATGIRLRAYDSSVTQILDTALTFGTSFSAAKFFGHWNYLQLQVDQNGANIDYSLVVQCTADNVGGVLAATLASRTIGIGRFVNTTATADLDGASVGHYGFISDPTRNTDAVIAMTGYRHLEDALQRFQRICLEEGLQYSADGALEPVGAMLMGPQPVGTVDEILADIEAANAGGTIHDGGPDGGLRFTLRNSRYNATVGMTINLTAKELAPGFEPTLDSEGFANDVTVSQAGGSPARFVNTASVAKVGRFPGPGATANLYSFGDVEQVAAWVTHVSSTPGMRYRTIEINLLKTPTLAAAWLASRIGSRIQVTNLMAGHPPGAVDVFLEGYTENLSPMWTATLNCSPAAPWQVFQEGDSTLARLHLDGQTVNTTAASNAGSLSVATAAGKPLLPTAAGEMPMRILVAGAELNVTAVSGSSSPQTLTATLANGIVKSLPAGTTVELASQHGLAL